MAEMAEGFLNYIHDPNLLVYCGYCVDSFLDGTLNNTLENLTEYLAASTQLPTTTESFFEEYYDDVQPENETEDDSYLCDYAKRLDSVYLDRLLLLPASIIIIFLSFFIQRKYLFQNIMNKRPGFIYPVNLLEGQEHRFSFVAAFVLVSWAMVDMVIATGNDAKEAFPFYEEEMRPNMKSFYVLAACIFRALEFYPIFASLTANNIFGFATGTIYSSIMMFVFLTDDRFCFVGTPANKAIQICRILPPALCLVYLCFYFLIKFIQCLIRKIKQEKATALALLSLMYFLIEQNKKALKLAMKVTKFKEEWQQAILDYIALQYEVDIRELYHSFIKEMLFWMNWVIQPVIYTSIIVAFLSVLLSMLLTMKNYRNNLHAIYKNQHDYLQKFETFKPRGILVTAVKYVGYQISYAAWGFVIQFGILFLILMFLMTILIFMFRYGCRDILLNWAFNKFWCLIVTIIFLMLVQNLMAHFIFLRRGDNHAKVMALDNRRIFFNFHYFATFTNIAVGLLSCILRIFRAVFFGLWTVPRLDMSTLNRDFERLDAGYMSYVGLLYLEHTQRNPTMLVFINVLLETISSESKNWAVFNVNNKTINKKATLKFKRARNRYQLWVTLERNPGLRLLRKNAPALPLLIKDDPLFRKMQLLNQAKAKKQSFWSASSKSKVDYMEKNQTKF